MSTREAKIKEFETGFAEWIDTWEAPFSTAIPFVLQALVNDGIVLTKESDLDALTLKLLDGKTLEFDRPHSREFDIEGVKSILEAVLSLSSGVPSEVDTVVPAENLEEIGLNMTLEEITQLFAGDPVQAIKSLYNSQEALYASWRAQPAL